MSLKCGIVGLPNVGKSTLFNALTKAGIAAENYPFCTIEPNVGIGHPGDRAEVVNFVLNAPRKEEQDLIDDALQRALDVAASIIEGKMEAAMLKLHSN